MQNIRPLSERKWDVTKHAFYQAYHFAMRYNEFKDVLKYKISTVGSPNTDGMPKGGEPGNATQDLAITRQQAERNCRLIERTAAIAGGEIYTYLLKAVTEEGISYQYLKRIMNIPCGKNLYYDRRRKFYYLLSKEI